MGLYGFFYLHLIPKGEGNLSPLNFRPISVTSSIYRLFTKYYSKELSLVARKHMSPSQQALLPDTSISTAIINIHDHVHNNCPIHLPFESITGVKQGCPLAPYLLLLVLR